MSKTTATTWRALAMLVLFLSGQTGLLLHAQELDAHLDNGHCQVCLHADSSNPVPVSFHIHAARIDISAQQCHATKFRAPFPSTYRVNTARAPPYSS